MFSLAPVAHARAPEELYGENATLPTDVADRLIQSTPTNVSVKMLHPIEQQLRFIDQCVASALVHRLRLRRLLRELFARLRNRGFLLPADDDSFLQRLLIRRGAFVRWRLDPRTDA